MKSRAKSADGHRGCHMERFTPLFLVVAALVVASCTAKDATTAKQSHNPAATSILNAKLRCAEVGWLYHRRLEQDFRGSATLLNPEFRYEAGRDTCLYKGGYISKDISEQYIIDLSENSTIAAYYPRGADQDNRQDRQREFEAAEKKFFR